MEEEGVTKMVCGKGSMKYVGALTSSGLSPALKSFMKLDHFVATEDLTVKI